MVAGGQFEMEDFISGLTEKVGIDRATAEKVVAFIKDHADEIPGWLAQSGIMDKLPGGLGDKLEGMLGMGGEAQQ
jgi:hypothetical protein